MKYTITGKIEIFNMVSPWRYISVPKDKVPPVKTGGWGSIPLMVTLGKTTWRTSMFPMKKDHYFIPLKKPVLRKEEFREGNVVTVHYQVART